MGVAKKPMGFTGCCEPFLQYRAGLPPAVLGPSILSKGVKTDPTETQIGSTYAQTMPHFPGACLR